MRNCFHSSRPKLSWIIRVYPDYRSYREILKPVSINAVGNTDKDWLQAAFIQDNTDHLYRNERRY